MEELQGPLLPKPFSRQLSYSSNDIISPLQTVAIVVCFVIVRSVHVIIIDTSKTDGVIEYGKTTPCVVNCAVDVVLGNMLAFAFGGKIGVKQCWHPSHMKVFGTIAAVYAFSDFMEMRALNVMSAAAYQILLQSKLLITAILVFLLRGWRQTSLQLLAIFTVVLGMIFFVLCDDSPFVSHFQPIGLVYVLVKVFVSCLCALTAEMHLKQYSEVPLYAQVAMMKVSWFAVTFLLTLTFDYDVIKDGFFAGWDWRTIMVAASWVCKGWTTFLVLKKVHFVYKNIGDAAAILATYLFDACLAPKVATYLPVDNGAFKNFQLATFLMVIVIAQTVVTYTLSPTWQRKLS